MYPRPIPGVICHLVVLAGPHRTSIGWMRGTWDDKVKQLACWAVQASQAKVFVNGIKDHSIAIRFDLVREATALEVCLWEQDNARK